MVYMYPNIFIYQHIFRYQLIYILPSVSIWLCSYVYVSRPDLLELDNLCGTFFPWRQWILLSQHLLTIYITHLGVGLCGISSVYTGISTGVMMLVLFRQPYCSEFIDDFSLSCIGDMIHSRHLWPLSRRIFLSSLSWFSLSLKYRGCIVDVSI